MKDTSSTDPKAPGVTMTIHGTGGHNPELVNDGIMDKPIERAPLLSDVELMGVPRPPKDATQEEALAYMVNNKRPMTVEEVRAWYEAKITSGELRVVKKATLVQQNGMKVCSLCDHRYEYYEELAPEVGEFCRCGAQIMK